MVEINKKVQKRKKLAQAKILIDSNSYFRLAREIHPLLFQEFGQKNYCLYVLKELEQEYERSPRLKSKFTWVSDPEYTANRSKRISLSKAQKNERPTVFNFMWEHVVTSLPGPSKIDVIVLSYGYVLEIPVVTDDDDMRQLAKVFDVKTYKSLDLMKLMSDCNHIDLAMVRRIVAYWRYDDDLPKSFSSDYRQLFGEEPP